LRVVKFCVVAPGSLVDAPWLSSHVESQELGYAIREGEVYRRLLEKLEEARAALGGKVYGVLGELFEGHALRDPLVDAIRYGDRPEKKAELEVPKRR
jgi:hypothetical protein